MARESEALVLAEEDNMRLRRKLDRLGSKSKEAMATGLKVTVATGSAFGLAWLEARYPERKEIMGMPLAAVVGGGALVAGAAGWAGAENAAILEAVGVGGLAAWAASRGKDSGEEARQKAEQK
jgi:hypothetical protein